MALVPVAVELLLGLALRRVGDDLGDALRRWRLDRLREHRAVHGLLDDAAAERGGRGDH